MSIGILDLTMCNIGSVFNAVYELGYDPVIVKTADEFDDLTHLILPGVGHFQEAMSRIKAKSLDIALKAFVQQRPLLGICLGMQLLVAVGTEGDGETAGLGFVPGRVERFSQTDLRVPHVGWNEVQFAKPHPIFEGVKDHRDFYFTHSYHVICDEANAYGLTPYGETFPSVIGAEFVVGCQFHPEKSQKNGLLLLENFCEWDGQC